MGVDNFIPLLTKSVGELTDGYFAEDLLTRQKKSRKKQQTKTGTIKHAFTINSTEARNLYRLSIPRNEDNRIFINAEESDSDSQFQTVLSRDGYRGPTFTFDFEIKYVAFVLRWLRTNNKKFPSFGRIEKMNCFYTQCQNKPVTEDNLQVALGTLEENHKKFLNKNYVAKNYKPPQTYTDQTIPQYLCWRLKEIFFPESQ